MLATQNRYLKPVVPIIAGLVVALVLLAIGSLISGIGLSGQGNSTLNWGDAAKWGSGLLGGIIIAYLLYVQFVEAPIWQVYSARSQTFILK
jgi:hypothetical protein